MSKAMTVTVADVKGSTPREIGAFMRIWPDRQEGSIGGGALEWEATGIAREMLAQGKSEARRVMPLGPDLGQCCGGVVTLSFQKGDPRIETDKTDLWIWGAGHVGRAIAQVVAPLDRHEVVLIDTTPDRMPQNLSHNIRPLIAAEPTRLVTHAPQSAMHLILTFSHDLDFALCDALLRHGFAQAGLIGSKTKWARFRKRLAALGHEKQAIAQIACPIGDPSLGKDPQAIAVSVAAALLSGAERNTALGEKT